MSMSTLVRPVHAAPDAEVFGYGKSLPVDRRLVEDDLTGSVAWAEALARAGVLYAADAARSRGPRRRPRRGARQSRL